MPRSGHSEHPAGVRHQFGMMSDFSVEQRPPSRWNTVRHQHGVVSAIAWNTHPDLCRECHRRVRRRVVVVSIEPCRVTQAELPRWWVEFDVSRCAHAKLLSNAPRGSRERVLVLLQHGNTGCDAARGCDAWDLAGGQPSASRVPVWLSDWKSFHEVSGLTRCWSKSRNGRRSGVKATGFALAFRFTDVSCPVGRYEHEEHPFRIEVARREGSPYGRRPRARGARPAASARTTNVAARRPVGRGPLRPLLRRANRPHCLKSPDSFARGFCPLDKAAR